MFGSQRLLATMIALVFPAFLIAEQPSAKRILPLWSINGFNNSVKKTEHYLLQSAADLNDLRKNKIGAKLPIRDFHDFDNQLIVAIFSESMSANNGIDLNSIVELEAHIEIKYTIPHFQILIPDESDITSQSKYPYLLIAIPSTKKEFKVYKDVRRVIAGPAEWELQKTSKYKTIPKK